MEWQLKCITLFLVWSCLAAVFTVVRLLIIVIGAAVAAINGAKGPSDAAAQSTSRGSESAPFHGQQHCIEETISGEIDEREYGVSNVGDEGVA